MTSPQLTELGVYLAAAAVYIGVGLWNTNFLLSWPVAAVYLLFAAWLIPAGIRKLRG